MGFQEKGENAQEMTSTENMGHKNFSREDELLSYEKMKATRISNNLSISISGYRF